LLDWSREEPLVVKVSRNGKEKSITISPEIKEYVRKRSSERRFYTCANEDDRYKDFRLAYQGENICLHEGVKDTAVLRVKSFQYDPDSIFTDFEAEVFQFWKNYWQYNSKKIKHLIIDVIDNQGGNDPIPLYRLLFDEPFQEQYARFKKIRELEDKDILKSFFLE